ncbi:MAG: Gfo/Idh/MocA family oxidoreductase, partial [Bryobacterales bacterium]|nr:Gfo/Idh/MocA family oxidoreductase [Bryobacterales bacterium]
CEKPIGVTAAQVRDLVKVAKGSKKVFTAGQQMRSYKHLQEAIGKIRGGAIGDVLWVKAQRHGTADLDHDGPSKDWYFDVTKSGGYLIEMSVQACGFGGIQLYKNDPAGRTIFDCGTISYDYANGVKMSFTQNVFHPRTLPGGGQYVYVYGSKGAADLIGAPTLHTLGRDGKSSPLAAKGEEERHAHIAAFYDAVTKGAASPADVTVGATAALTAILGHEAMTRQAVVNWKDVGVEVG